MNKKRSIKFKKKKKIQYKFLTKCKNITNEIKFIN